MQGLMAYYYDEVRPNTTVELNSCRFNHMGMDNLYHANGPGYMPKKSEWRGKCRSTRPDCEDCTTTNISQIYNVHYTECKAAREYSVLKRKKSVLCLWVFIHTGIVSSPLYFKQVGSRGIVFLKGIPEASTWARKV
jgi:hypothetical protein